MHRVRAFAWVRKHGVTSGWRVGHARNYGIPSRKLLKKRFAPSDRPHLTTRQPRILWSCTGQKIRGFYRTLRIQLEPLSRKPVSSESSLAAWLFRHAWLQRVLLLDKVSAHLLTDCSYAVIKLSVDVPAVPVSV